MFSLSLENIPTSSNVERLFSKKKSFNDKNSSLNHGDASGGKKEELSLDDDRFDEREKEKRERERERKKGERGAFGSFFFRDAGGQKRERV